MALRQRGARSSGRLFGAVVRAGVIVGFTAVETLALVVWFGFATDTPAVSDALSFPDLATLSVPMTVGIGVLIAGLFVEHFLTDLAVNDDTLSFPAVRVTAFSLSEAALWVLWLLIADAVGGVVGIAVAGVFLAVLLVPQHTIEDNVLRESGVFSDLIHPGTVGFSLLEAAGATVWLLFVRHGDLVEPAFAAVGADGLDPALAGVAVLALALLVEHGIGVRFSRRS